MQVFRFRPIYTSYVIASVFVLTIVLLYAPFSVHAGVLDAEYSSPSTKTDNTSSNKSDSKTSNTTAPINSSGSPDDRDANNTSKINNTTTSGDKNTSKGTNTGSLTGSNGDSESSGSSKLDNTSLSSEKSETLSNNWFSSFLAEQSSKLVGNYFDVEDKNIFASVIGNTVKGALNGTLLSDLLLSPTSYTMVDIPFSGGVAIPTELFSNTNRLKAQPSELVGGNALAKNVRTVVTAPSYTGFFSTRPVPGSVATDLNPAGITSKFLDPETQANADAFSEFALEYGTLFAGREKGEEVANIVTAQVGFENPFFDARCSGNYSAACGIAQYTGDTWTAQFGDTMDRMVALAKNGTPSEKQAAQQFIDRVNNLVDAGANLRSDPQTVAAVMANRKSELYDEFVEVADRYNLPINAVAQMEHFGTGYYNALKNDPEGLNTVAASQAFIQANNIECGGVCTPLAVARDIEYRYENPGRRNDDGLGIADVLLGTTDRFGKTGASIFTGDTVRVAARTTVDTVSNVPIMAFTDPVLNEGLQVIESFLSGGAVPQQSVNTAVPSPEQSALTFGFDLLKTATEAIDAAANGRDANVVVQQGIQQGVTTAFGDLLGGALKVSSGVAGKPVAPNNNTVPFTQDSSPAFDVVTNGIGLLTQLLSPKKQQVSEAPVEERESSVPRGTPTMLQNGGASGGLLNSWWKQSLDQMGDAYDLVQRNAARYSPLVKELKLDTNKLISDLAAKDITLPEAANMSVAELNAAIGTPKRTLFGRTVTDEQGNPVIEVDITRYVENPIVLLKFGSQNELKQVFSNQNATARDIFSYFSLKAEEKAIIGPVAPSKRPKDEPVSPPAIQTVDEGGFYEVPNIVSYDIGSATTRDEPVAKDYVEKLAIAAQSTLPGLKVEIFSAGQDENCDGNTETEECTGSIRHNVDGDGYGRTSDVRLILNGEVLEPGKDKAVIAAFVQNVVALGFNEIGVDSRPGNDMVHVGTGNSPAAWGYGSLGGKRIYLDPVYDVAYQAGLKDSGFATPVIATPDTPPVVQQPAGSTQQSGGGTEGITTGRTSGTTEVQSVSGGAGSLTGGNEETSTPQGGQNPFNQILCTIGGIGGVAGNNGIFPSLLGGIFGGIMNGLAGGACKNNAAQTEQSLGGLAPSANTSGFGNTSGTGISPATVNQFGNTFSTVIGRLFNNTANTSGGTRAPVTPLIAQQPDLSCSAKTAQRNQNQNITVSWTCYNSTSADGIGFPLQGGAPSAQAIVATGATTSAWITYGVRCSNGTSRSCLIEVID